MSSIPNYEGAAYDWEEFGDVHRFIKVFNDTGATINDGDVFTLSFAKGTVAEIPTLNTPATGTGNIIVVVANGSFGAAATILDDKYGWVQVKGHCRKVKVTSSLAAEKYLEVLNAVKVGSDATVTEGTNKNEAFGIVKVAADANDFSEVILFGRSSVEVKAS